MKNLRQLAFKNRNCFFNFCLCLCDGQPTMIGNKDEQISFPFHGNKVSPFRGIGNGQANNYSNTGKIVFQGTTSNRRLIY